MRNRARHHPTVNASAEAAWRHWGQNTEHHHSLQCKYSSKSTRLQTLPLLPATVTNPLESLQSETVLIQRVYTHFKKAPASHKLGVLYVVDSVTRAWVEQARKAGQTFGPSAPDGTFAAGVNRVTELLPSFMTDILTNCPEEQKVRLLESMVEVTSQVAFSVCACTAVATLICSHNKKKISASPVLVCNSILTYVSTD